MRISDWSSDVCSSDRQARLGVLHLGHPATVAGRIGPLALYLDGHGLGPAMRKALANLSGLHGLLQLQPAGPRPRQWLLRFLLVSIPSLRSNFVQSSPPIPRREFRQDVQDRKRVV